MDIGAHGRREREEGDGAQWRAAAGSLALHAAVIAVLLLVGGAFGHAPPRPPRMKVYAVNIVSPPPPVRGAPRVEPPAPNVGGSQAPAPQPVPPAPTPPPPSAPAPAPAPVPPRAAPPPPKEPARAPEPRTPEPRRPATPPTRPTPPKPAAT